MSDINVRIRYEGTERGAAQLERLNESLDNVDSAQQRAGASASSLGEVAQAAGTQWGQLGGALGNTASVFAQLNPRMATSASVLGQVGTASTALTGALGPMGVALAAVTTAVGLYQIAMERAREESEAQERSINALRVSYDDLHSSIVRTAQARRQFEAIDQRGEGTAEELQARQRQFQNRAAELTLRIQQLERERGSLTGQLMGPRTVGTLTMLRSQRRAAQRQAAQLGERIEGGTFLTDVESEIILDPTEQDLGRGGGGRRGGRRGQSASDDVGPGAALERRFAAEQEIRERNAANEQRRLEEITRAKDEAHAREMAQLAEVESAQQTAKEAEERAIERQIELQAQLLDKAKEAARIQRREAQDFAREASGFAQEIGSAYFNAFQQAIEGTMSLEDALLSATKQILKSIGEELVARGIGKILEGIAEIPSPTAATKIGGGTAMVAFGVTLGAAGAAIPSPGGGAEQPREERDQDGDEGPRTIVVNMNSPVLTAGTQAQVARGMRRSLAGDRTLPTSLGRA